MSDPDPATEVIVLSLPSRLELLAVLDRVTESICERLAFDEASRTQVSLSVIEAGTNAIQHGHQRDPRRQVNVEFRLRPDALEVTVRDSGEGFDPDAVNGDVTAPERRFDLRGRGIFIMRSCMDEVDYTFTGSGTVCRLVKRRPAAGSG